MITLNKEDAFKIVDIICKAQEIVRCTDCKYLHQLPDGQIYCENKDGLPLMIGELRADYFCSRGEKR